MTLNPFQFLKNHMEDNSIGRPEVPLYPIGAQVHDKSGKPGIVTAHHTDHRTYNVSWGRGNVGVHHEDELRG